jgi:glycosyltransferase involved in cell wall biosynthesis
MLLKQHPQVQFLLCGRGVTWEIEKLSTWLIETGFKSNFHLLGYRDDIPRVMNALDIHTLSSRAEAFPNVTGEAMASGVPCVATDVGDTAALIADTGISVPAGDPQALADGWRLILSMDPAARRTMGEEARRRIQENFSIQLIARRYEALYSQILSHN